MLYFDARSELGDNVETSSTGIPQFIFERLNDILLVELQKDAMTYYDIVSTLQSLKEFFRSSENRAGKTLKVHPIKRVPTFDGYDYIKDIKNHVEEFMLVNKELTKIKYRNFFTQVVVPYMESFRSFTHEQALEVFNDQINELIDYVMSFDYVYDSNMIHQAMNRIIERNRRQFNARQAAKHIIDSRLRSKK